MGVNCPRIIGRCLRSNFIGDGNVNRIVTPFGLLESSRPRHGAADALV